MFVSDEQNISRDIIDNYKADYDYDDDDIEDQQDKPSNGYGPPTGNNNSSKKNKIMMLMMMLMKKKKKKKKEKVSFAKSETATTGNNVNATKPNKVLFFPFNHPNKLLFKKSTPSSSSASSSCSANTAFASSNACFPGKTSAGCFCFKQPPTLESSSTATSTTLQSQTSDPNNPNFTFDMLKSLIETNDFYSKECNPHTLFSAD